MAYRCGKNCWGFDKCKKRTKCDCDCGELKAINPNLYEACYNACAEPPRPIDADDFMENFLGGEIMFNNYGLLIDGYNPYDSAQYQAFDEQEERKAEANAESGKWIKIIQIFFLAGIVLGLLWILIPSRKINR